MRQQPGFEYTIPCCVTSIAGVIPIHNYSQNALEFKQDQLLARGVPAEEEVLLEGVSNLTIYACNLQPFQLNDVLPRVDDYIWNKCAIVLILRQ